MEFRFFIKNLLKSFVIVIIFVVFLVQKHLVPSVSKDVIKISKLSGCIYKIDQNPTNNFVHLASIGDDGILIVDTGFKDTGEELYEKLKQYGNGNIRFVVNTHIHEDHVGSNGLFSKEALIISHFMARERFFKPYYSLPPIDLAGAPALTFVDSLHLYFNGEKIVLKHVRNGHTDGDVTVYFPDSKILYVGDLIIHNRFSTVDLSRGGDINGFIANLETLINDYPDDTRFFAAHGPEYDKSRLRIYHEAFVSTFPLIKNELKNGKKVDEIVNSEIFKKYKNWERKRDWIEVIKRRLGGKSVPSICEVMTKVLVEKGLPAAIEKCHFLRRRFPGKYNFNERELNNLGYALLDRDMIGEAIAVFKLNVKIYPKSSNVYDSLGDAYIVNGEKEKAIQNFKKSLKLDPSNKHTRNKLEKLLKK